MAWILLVFNQSMFLSKEAEHIGIISQTFFIKLSLALLKMSLH